MATLANSLDAIYFGKHESKCKTAQLLKSLDEEDRKALEQVLEDLSVTAKSITKWLNQNGHQISMDSIRRHRKRQMGGCLCPRESSL